MEHKVVKKTEKERRDSDLTVGWNYKLLASLRITGVIAENVRSQSEKTSHALDFSNTCMAQFVQTNTKTGRPGLSVILNRIHLLWILPDKYKKIIAVEWTK